MLKQQSHIVAPIPDELRTRALYTVSELKGRGKADKEDGHGQNGHQQHAQGQQDGCSQGA